MSWKLRLAKAEADGIYTTGTQGPQEDVVLEYLSNWAALQGFDTFGTTVHMHTMQALNRYYDHVTPPSVKDPNATTDAVKYVLTTPRFGLYFLPKLTFEKALMFCQSLASAAGGAAQLPFCAFFFHGKRGRTNGHIQIAISGRNPGCHPFLQTSPAHSPAPMPSQIG